MTIVERYFSALRELGSLGGATPELSTYACIVQPVQCNRRYPQTQGGQSSATWPIRVAGVPTLVCYVKRGQPKGKKGQGTGQSQKPERGVVEVKPAADDAWLTADSSQVSKYWEHYRLVLVTNTRDFILLGEDAAGNSTKLETFRLASSSADFDKRLQQPRKFAGELGGLTG